MKIKLNKLSLALLCVITLPLNAKIVTPVFSGNFFVDANYIGEDSCLADQFSYDQIGGNVNSLVINYLNTHNPSPSCSWSITTVNPSSNQTMPNDFPGLNSDEWQQAIKQNPNAIDMQANAACITPNHVIQNQMTVEVSPHYICPPSSRLSLDENMNPPQIGCTTTPTLCIGDVAGRDFNAPIIGALGHVGITDYAYVTQVEPSPLISDVSFDTFKTASPYWGDKYGTSQYPNLTADQGVTIELDIAYQEAASDNGMYFIIPIFTPAQSAQTPVYNQEKNQWQLQYVLSAPLFRCDTFIDWIYYQALGETLVPFTTLNSPWNELAQYSYIDVSNLPKDLFNSLVSTRDNGNTTDLENTPKLSSTEQSLIIQTTNNLLSDQSSRQAKIDFYWQQLNQNLDDFQYLVTLNALSYLKPVELIPALISDFQDTPNLTHQKFLLNVIISALQINPTYVQPQDQSAIVIGQEFLASELISENNPQLLGMALYGYISATPYDQNKASQVNNALARLAEIKKVDAQSLFIYNFLLDANDPTGNSLTQLIKTLQGTKYQPQFTTFLSENILNGLTQSMLSSSNRSIISNYLENQINQMINSPDNSQGEQSYRLIKAYGLFTNNQNYAITMILNIQNTSLEASLILAALDDPNGTQIIKAIKTQKQQIIQTLNQTKVSNTSNEKAVINKLYQSQ